ncbi:hypothetical protein DL96DRAFT_1620337 [Flagelloscypha sp. PMI_526]|nr:hypothetical protein DL96DRAFT_1620337 [Flagelloscypha sp. PMI_526]
MYHPRSDPYFFRCVVVGTHASPAMAAFIASFDESSPSPRLLEARNYVKMFATRQTSENEPLFRGILSKSPDWLWSLDIPSLRRITFNLPSFNQSLFRSAGLESMASLTHLVLDATEVGPDLDPVLENASAHLSPGLQVLLILVSRHQDITNEKYDARIVLGIRPDGDLTESEDTADYVDVVGAGWKAWTGQMKEEDTFWAFAERKVKEKNIMLKL